MAPLVARVREFARERPVLALAVAIVGCEIVGGSGAVFTSQGLSSWYGTLTRPAVAPPNWVFGPVWTTLFALLGAALWLVWRRAATAGDRETARRVRVALAAFTAQFAVNLAWSLVFFAWQSIDGGLAVIVALWLLIVATAWAFFRVDRRAAALLLPYLAWVTFAAYLNYRFWALN